MKKQLVAVLSTIIAASSSLVPGSSLADSGLRVVNTDSSGAIVRSVNGNMQAVAIMPDDRTALIQTDAANFVTGYTPNQGAVTLFFHDMITGQNRFALAAADGGAPNAVVRYVGATDDGSVVAFNTTATNLGVTAGRFGEGIIEALPSGNLSSPCANLSGFFTGCRITSVSHSGRYIGISTNWSPSGSLQFSQAYIFDVSTHQVIPVSQATDPGHNVADGAVVSPDETKVMFYVSPGSGGGQSVTPHIYSYDILTGQTVLVDKNVSGVPGNNAVFTSDHHIVIMPGSRTVFSSYATNLVPGVTDGHVHVYMVDPVTSSVQMIDQVGTTSSNSDSFQPSADRAGRFISFVSDATNLDEAGVSREFPSVQDHIYTKDMSTGEVRLVDRDSSGRTYYANVQYSSISPSGKYLIFNSTSLLWDPADVNPTNYVYMASNTVFDTTPPTVTGTLDRQPNAAGWYNGDVNISWTPADPAPSSGAPSVPAVTVASLEGTHTYTSGQSCDPAGNCATGSIDLKIDTQKPTISYSLGTPPNGAGWNKDDVLVTFTCDDPTSGIDSCTAPVTVGEGKNQKITGTAVDKAGNTQSVDVFVSVDKQKPTISYALTPAANAAGWNKSNFTVTFMCLDQASLSGLASCTTPVTVSAETAGQDIVGTAVDVADNSQTVTAHIKLDKTLPTASNITMSGLVLGLLIGGTTNVSANVADANAATGVVSGVVAAEYFFDTDPGEGLGMAMTVHPNSTATSVANAPGIGQHTLYVRSKDAAGNWSVKAGKAFTRLL